MKCFLAIALILNAMPNLFAGQHAKTELEKTFLKAAKDGNSNIVQECLEKGVNPNVRDVVKGNTALHYMLRADPFDFKNFFRLLNHPHTNLNIQNLETGDTPLHMATTMGWRAEEKNSAPAIFQELGIESPKEFYEESPQKYRVFIITSALCTKLLLQKQANPNIANYYHKLPIHEVTNTKTLQLLIHHESHIDATLLSEWFIGDNLNHLSLAISAKNFSYEIARAALVLMKRQAWLTDYKKDCNKARVLLYFCTLFNLLKSPEPKDPQKYCFPILPREIIHHYFAIPATKTYIDLIQEKK